MKNLSSATLAHLAGETTTYAIFIKITRKDATVKAFTSHVSDVVYDSVTYKSSSGLALTNVESSVGKGVNNANAYGLIDSVDITDIDLITGKYDDASVEVFMLNYNDLTQDKVGHFKGFIGEVQQGRKYFESEVRSLIQRAFQLIGKTTQASCRANLGDSDCSVNLASFTFSGTVLASSSKTAFTTSTASIVSQAENYFAYGKLTFTSGDNNGISAQVRTNNSALPMTFTLMDLLPYVPGVGDSFTLIAGCDKRLTTCINKFNNVLNFRGEPYVPGADAVLRIIQT